MWLHKISFYKKFPPSEDDCLLLALEILYVWRAFNTCSSAVLNNILSGEVWPFSDLSALNVWVVIVRSSGLNLNLLCSFSWSSQRDLVIAKLSRRSTSDLLALFTRRKGNTSPSNLVPRVSLLYLHCRWENDNGGREERPWERGCSPRVGLHSWGHPFHLFFFFGGGGWFRLNTR